MSLKQNIVIIDYGVGNTYSVSNAIKHLGYKNITISDQKNAIDDADVLILPGVGAFEEAINNLRSRGLDDILDKAILVQKKPILGICVGMQLMATFSEENGIHKGLNWIEGKVIKLDLPAEFAVPHVGWNNVTYAEPLFGAIPSECNFYFDHSFHFDCEDKYITGYSDYGLKVTASIQKENIFGVQFHPEKSQTSGLKLFRGFFNLIK